MKDFLTEDLIKEFLTKWGVKRWYPRSTETNIQPLNIHVSSGYTGLNPIDILDGGMARLAPTWIGQSTACIISFIYMLKLAEATAHSV